MINIFERCKERFDEEIVENLLQYKNVRIEKIISDNHVSDWYDQGDDEYVCLLSGYAELEFLGKDNNIKTVALNPGDTLLIKKHERHRVSKTTQCNWLCIFIGENNF